MSSTSTTTTRRGIALALLAGPIITTAGMAATPWEPESTSASLLETMAAHPTQAQIAALLLIVGYALVGLAAFVVLGHAREASAKLRVPAYVLAFCGATVLPGMVTTDWFMLALAQHLPLAQGAGVMDVAHGYGLFGAVRIPAVGGYVLGGLLVVVCAWRAGLVGAWAIGLTLLGFAAPVAGPIGIVGGSAIAVVVYAAMAVRLAGPVARRAPRTATASPATRFAS